MKTLCAADRAIQAPIPLTVTPAAEGGFAGPKRNLQPALLHAAALCMAVVNWVV